MFFIYHRYKSHKIYDLQIFSPNLWFIFSLLWWKISHTFVACMVLIVIISYSSLYFSFVVYPFGVTPKKFCLIPSHKNVLLVFFLRALYLWFTLISLIHLKLSFHMLWNLTSLICIWLSILPTPFVEKTILPLLNSLGTLVKKSFKLKYKCLFPKLSIFFHWSMCYIWSYLYSSVTLFC